MTGHTYADRTRYSSVAFKLCVAPWYSTEHASGLKKDLCGSQETCACAFLYMIPSMMTSTIHTRVRTLLLFKTCVATLFVFACMSIVTFGILTELQLKEPHSLLRDVLRDRMCSFVRMIHVLVKYMCRIQSPYLHIRGHALAPMFSSPCSCFRHASTFTL
jgi:hypothetical protein